MTANLHKLQYYFQLYPDKNTPLSPDSLAQGLRDYLRQSHPIVFRFEEVDLFDQPFIDEKLQQFYQSQTQGTQRQVTVEQFLLGWVRNDEKLKIDFPEYQQMVKGLVTKQLSSLQKKAVSAAAKDSHSSNSKPITNTDRSLIDTPKTNLTEKKKVAHPKSHYAVKSPAASSNENQNKIKTRLYRLFDFFVRRDSRHASGGTFTQVGNSFETMSLPVWMVFNREFNITSLLGKEQVHLAFKKFYDIKSQMLNFDAFEKAIKYLLDKIHPQNENDGWKVLSIHEEEAFANKLKGFGLLPLPQGPTPVPKSFGSLPRLKEDSKINSGGSPKKKIHTKKNNQNDENTSLYNSLNIEKLSKLQLEVDIPIEINENEDEVFLKEYKITKKVEKQEDSYANKAAVLKGQKSTKIKPALSNSNSQANLGSLNSSPAINKLSTQNLMLGGNNISEGLLGRMDQRIKKYTRS